MIYKPYKSIKDIVEAVYIVKKSKFICRMYPITDDEQAFELISRQSKEYKDATHNCYAFVVDNIERYSDDGEPQGTAGMPMLSLLKARGLSGVLAVCTRYFGGIKLGVGGLSDAYRSSLDIALEKCNIIQMEYCTSAIITVDYQGLAALQNSFSTLWWTTTKPVFGEQIAVPIAFRVEDKEKAIENIKNLTLGRAEIQFLEEKYESVR